MPIKLMVWNIQFFTQKKLKNDFEGKKRNYIVSTIKKFQPDIFVIIETMSGRGALGGLIQGNGALGVIELLAEFREFSKEWCLVPPLKLVDEITTEEREEGGIQIDRENNYTEGIAVFFRNDKLKFVGPYIWPVNNQPEVETIAVEDQNVTSTPYEGMWEEALQLKPGDEKKWYAGQFEFKRVAGSKINFHKQHHRRPFLTRFVERNQPQRTISLYSVHSPPKLIDAATAIGSIAEIPEISKPIDNNKVIVIAGDFNYDPRPDRINPQNIKTLTSGAFKYLSNYTIHFNSKKQYEYEKTTMLAKINNASPLSNVLIPKDKKYKNTLFYRKNFILDNVLTRYGANANRPNNHNAIVVDRIAGDIDITDMQSTLRYFQSDLSDKGKVSALTRFQEWVNYGHIGPTKGASDHLPLIIDI